MKIRYYPDTDTLHIELRQADVAETRDLDDDTLVDIDAGGRICGITFEHARSRTDVARVSIELAAPA